MRPIAVLSYSDCLVASVTGVARRGVVQSVFRAAANITFPGAPGEFVLALNALDAPRVPNGLRLSALAGTFPFSDLQIGMPVLFGAQRLHIEPLALSLDLTYCERWNSHIARPEQLNPAIIEKNRMWLVHYLVHLPGLASMHPSFSSVQEMAQTLCGRGPGLTPSGDDMLAGWMVANWLLHGPHPRLLAACQQILAIAERQTHLLSRCWLHYAAQGHAAEPVGKLLTVLTHDYYTDANEEELISATQAVLALGATSGRDIIQGILLGLSGMPGW